MVGNDLIVEIPWIIFCVSLAVVCVRLRGSRRFSHRSRDREQSRQPSDDGNDHDQATASSSTQPPTEQPPTEQPSEPQL